jgi:hypothetical protein
MTFRRFALAVCAAVMVLAGAIGISGDGIDQDDFVSSAYFSTQDAPEFGFDVSAQ